MPEIAAFKQAIQEADWTKEKHVPIIECPDEVTKDEFFDVTVTLGRAIAHPNTTEHHIRWMDLYYQGQDEKFIFQIARFEFCAHGESVAGPNEGPAHTHHEGCTKMKASKSGTLFALAYCNIHGLWEGAKDIKVV
ncbi:MAG: Neelaredoxin [Planctomycetes bacterium]|jgi:superoxide reductase|nr:Neelaredoxin [Planctomycetota bacterium]